MSENKESDLRTPCRNDLPDHSSHKHNCQEDGVLTDHGK